MWLSLYPFSSLFLVFAPFRNKADNKPRQKTSPSIDPFRKSHLWRGGGGGGGGVDIKWNGPNWKAPHPHNRGMQGISGRFERF